MKISIVTTVYNIENYLKQCLDSILNSSYKDIEVIVVNDCSTDDSMKIINEYDDDRLVIVNHDVNMGAGWARRHGIEVATGDYIITIDGDDWISPNFIEDLVNNAKETNADIVSGGITIVWSEEYQEVKRFSPMISTGFKKFKDYHNQKIIFLNNKLVRREMYTTVPYCTRRFCEDTPVILPLLYYANAVSYVDNQGYFYRQHEASLCHSVNTFAQSLFKALCCKDIIEFFADKGPQYSKMINPKEFELYLRTVKNQGNKSLFDLYNKELGELTPYLLNVLFSEKENTPYDPEYELQERLTLAIKSAENLGFKNNGNNDLVHIICLGNSPIPVSCVESWKKYLENKTVCLWTEQSLDMSHPWVQQSINEKNYKFAEDYLKLWCMYFYGGIYINKNVELTQSVQTVSDFFVIDQNKVSLDFIFGATKKSDMIASMAVYYNDLILDPEIDFTQSVILTNLFKENNWNLEDSEFKGFTLYSIEQLNLQLFS